MSKNVLYYGDNLDILQRHVEDESVDLIYLDPPFKSNQDYNVLFKEYNGTMSAAQIKAFEDTWHWDEEAARAYEDIIEHGPPRVSQAMQAFRQLLGESDMLAYLSMMAPRLVELRRVLKRTGSIYLHCDPTASAHLRLLMDSIFGESNFRNEIVWKRTSAHSDSSTCGNTHDVLLFYTKSDDFIWNKQYQKYDEDYIESHYRRKDKNGRRYRTDNLTAMGLSGGGYTYEWNGVTKIWRMPKDRMRDLHNQGRVHYTKNGTAEYIRYLDEMPGMPLQDVWTDIPPINSQAAERLGYPTQKPEAMLERILKTSSNPNDVILDPFCGCGTTVAVAQKLKRYWIGMDITHLAITLIKYRLRDAYGDKVKYVVVGEPVSVPDANSLAQEDRFQFQIWALGLVGARPVEEKRGADRGIDGRIYFHDDPKAKTKQIILSIKSGKVTVKDVRDLRGVIEREGAEIGILITLEKPTKDMRRETTSAGFYESKSWDRKHPRLQILTIEELFNGKQIDYPPHRQVNRTFRKTRRVLETGAPHPNLPFEY